MKKQYKWLIAIITIGVLYRLAFINTAVVNYDDGLYVHNAYLILTGQIPVVDYPSRSPLFHFALLPYYFLPFDIVTDYRLVMTGLAVFTTLMVYLVATRLHSTRAGLLAAAIYFVNPVTASYGLWIKTEILATGLVLAAVYIILQGFDTNKSSYFAAAGIILGLGVLVRRSVLIVGVIIGAYIVWHYRRDLRVNTTTASAYSLGAIGATVFSYGVMTAWTPTLMHRFFEVHIIDLVADGGFGAFDYLHFRDLSEYLVDADTAIRDWPLFRKFGPLVINRIETIIRENLLVIIPLLGFFRGYMSEEDGYEHIDRYVRIAVVALAAALFAQHAMFSFFGSVNLFSMDGLVYARAAWTALLFLAGTLLFYVLPKIPVSVARRGHVSLVWWIFLGLVFAYVARNRVVYMEYWLDLLPYASILAAIGALYWIDTVEWNPRLKHATGAWVITVFIVTSVLVSPMAFAYSGNQFHPSDVRDIRGSVIENTHPGDTVLTAQPMFVVGTNRHVALDLGRSYYFIREAPGSPLADELSWDLENAVCDSSAVVTGPAMKVLLNYNPRIEERITECHEPVRSVRMDMNTGDERSDITVWRRTTAPA